MNPHQVWQAVLGELRSAMAPATFETWVQNVRAVGQDDGTFTIAAPNSFAQEWLAGRFAEQIEATLARILGRCVELAVVVEDWRPGGPAERRHDLAAEAVGHVPRHPDDIPVSWDENDARERARRARSGADALRARRADRIWIEDDLLRAGYTQCLNVLLPATKIGACDKIVFFGLLSFAWQDDAAWPSVEALGARVGLSRRAVLYALAELKRVGLLKVRRRGQGYTNLYEIPRVTRALLERIGAVEPDEADDAPAEDEDLVVVEDLTEAAGVTRLSNLILTARGLNATDKLVYVGLRSFAMRKAHCRLKMRTLARRIGMSERTVETHIGRLRAAGLVTRRRRGLGRANLYTLVRIHPAVLEAIQEPRYVAAPLPDDLPDGLVDRCTLCRRPIPEPAPALEAILKCSACCSAGGLGPAVFPQNSNPCTSRSEVHDQPEQDGKACTSGSAPSAGLQVPGLPSHAQDPVGEDPNEERTDPSHAAPGVDDPAALVWYAALGELEGLVTRTAFETCFRDSEAVSWEGDTLTVAAAHRFAQEWIDVRYRPDAEEALRRVLAGVPELVDQVPRLVVEVRRPAIPPERPDCERGGRAARRRLREAPTGAAVGGDAPARSADDRAAPVDDASAAPDGVAVAPDERPPSAAGEGPEPRSQRRGGRSAASARAATAAGAENERRRRDRPPPASAHAGRSPPASS
jgi:DNA-binding transcriptional ArsR family regulator